MKMENVYKCLEMGIVGGVISWEEANEAKKILENNKEPGNDLLTRKEAAKLINMHYNSLDRYARENKIDKIQTVFGPRYKRSQLLKKMTTRIK